MKSRLLAFLLLGVFFISVKAEIPPVFGPEYTGKMQKDELTRVFISPQRVVWKNAGNNQLVSNEEGLLRPGNSQSELGRKNMCKMTSTENDTASILLDYGKELHGGLQLVLGSSPRREPSLVRIRFGESVGECNSQTRNSEWGVGFATDDHAKRDIVMEVPRDGLIEIGNTGFRFVRIDLLQKNTTIHLKEARAILRYRDIPYLGSFKSNDERLNQIWLTGAYTVHLNMQEYLWDGIKRDRLIWLGDMHPEVATIASVFGYNEVVPKNLDLACEQYPLPNWMNNMSAYSLWYLIIHYDWYMYNGNLDFLKKHKPYLLGLIDLINGKVDENGNENLSSARFLDWPSSPNEKGVEAGYRALIVWAMQDAEKLCAILKEPEYGKKARDCYERMNRHIKDPNQLKQAASLMAIAGIMDPAKACNEVVSVGGPKGFSTFYGYYMLQAQAMAGQYREAMDVIRQYWGGMLDMGATTFWEDFNMEWLQHAARLDELTPAGKKDIHGAFGAYCYPGYRHSLCHGWASGPTAWMTEHILGVKVMEPGCKLIRIEPHLGDLKWVEGTFPTPYGIVKIKHTKNSNGKITSKIEAPREVKIIRVETEDIDIRVANYRGDKACAISYTFDDALKEHYTMAAPELEKRGFRGTFWVNGKRMEEESVNSGNTFTTWAELKAMAVRGHEISNHGWSHAKLTEVSPEVLKTEIEKNDRVILKETGIRSTTFCYPYNAMNKEVIQLASQNRVGTRTEQVSIGTKSTPEKLDQWVRELIGSGKWGVGMTHGITHGYDAFGSSSSIFWDHLDRVKALEDSVWVGTFREVVAYTKEKKDITCEIKKGKNSVQVIPKMTLDKALFTEPLTMVMEKNGIRKITAKQDNQTLAVQLSADKALFEFNPFGGPVQIDFQ